MVAEAIILTLRHLVTTLNSLGQPWAVVGGVAVSAWHHLRNTKDLDFVIAVGNLGIEHVLKCFHGTGVRAKCESAVLQIDGQRIIQYLYEPPETFLDIQIDLIVAETKYQCDALSRRVQLLLPGMHEPVFILGCEDLIIFKLIAGRIIDLADAASLLRANCDTLDLALLKHECERNNLTSELFRIWSEAFSGQTFPAGRVR